MVLKRNKFWVESAHKEVGWPVGARARRRGPVCTLEGWLPSQETAGGALRFLAPGAPP
jgi:hypothetical protein